MNTQHDPMDDVIELTDIVEEGSPADTDFDDFAMDRAVDAESLDRELDDLLREEPPAPADSLTDDTALTPPPQEPVSAPESQQDDLSDLDDLFDSLQLDDNDDLSSLDMFLDEKSLAVGEQGAPDTTDEDTIDLDLDIPDLQPAASEPDLLELTDDLLADIPDTVLASPGEMSEPTPPESSTIFVPESPEVTLDDVPVAPVEEPLPQEPSETAPEEPVEDALPAETTREHTDFAQSHLEILSSRIDALEARPESAPEMRPELLLAALPDTPGELPLARALRDEVMQAVDEKIAALNDALGLPEIRQMAEGAAARLDALENAPAPETEIAPEKVLAALPESPEELPLARALRDEVMQAMDEKIASLNEALGLPEIRQMAEGAAARLDALENAPAPETEIAPEKVLAALPESPEELPLARALRDGIMQAMDEKITVLNEGLAGHATSEAVEELRNSLTAVQEQVDAMPETLARLSASTAPALQDLENGVSSLNTVVEELRLSLAGAKEALAERDETIAVMREEGERMREEIEALNARLEAQPDAASIRNDLEEHVRQQVPATVARVIRKEIQALLKEMEG